MAEKKRCGRRRKANKQKRVQKQKWEEPEDDRDKMRCDA